jgi:predicted RNase H-like nuclease
MICVGVDGCKAGWFTVKLIEQSNWEVNVFQDIRSLWNSCKDASLILIDIPIGLVKNGSNERKCDILARDLLSSERRSSVFVTPCRDAVYADVKEASDINNKLTNRKLSKQVLGIILKIKQVDQLLISNNVAQLRIKEVHPELCYWALNYRNSMVFNKKDRRGIRERKEVLFSRYPHCELIFKYAERAYDRKDVARDDILDALAAAVTASKGEQVLINIPENPEIDAKGLPMQMVYYPVL